MDGQDSVDAIINALLNERNRAIWNCSVPTIGTGNVTGTGGRIVDLSNPSQSTRVEFAVEDLPVRNMLNQNAILSGSTRDSRRGHPGGLSRDEKRSRNREIQARYRARQRELRLQTEQKYESMLAQLQQSRLENQRQKIKLEILGKLLTVRSSFANTLENSSVKLNNDDNDGNIGRQGNFRVLFYSRNAFIMVDMPMHRACMYEDKSYDAKRKLAVQKIMPMYSKFIVHVYGIAKYRPKLMLRFFPDPNDSRKSLVGNMSPIVSCLHFSEEQKQSILDARDACCASRNGRLAMLSEKYLVLQEVFESSSFESMQAMTKSYLDLFDGAGRFIEGALDDLELNEIMIWMAKMGRTMDILQKCVMFGMCYPQLPNIVQIPDLC